MTPELNVFLELAPRLEQNGFEYMLTGSVALMHYAQPRMTRDIDVVIELNEERVESFLDLLGPKFACDEDAAREAITHQKMFNAIHIEHVVKLDFVIRKDTAYRREEFRRKIRTSILQVPVYLVSLEDLILSKLVWAKDSHSDYQLRDVRSLLSLPPPPDWDYMNKWALPLGVKELLNETLQP